MALTIFKSTAHPPNWLSRPFLLAPEEGSIPQGQAWVGARRAWETGQVAFVRTEGPGGVEVQTLPF